MIKKTIFILFILAAFSGFSQTSDWLISAGGKHSDCGYALAVDDDQYIYLAGSFQGQSQFGTKNLTSNGDTDIFLAKYSSAGKLIWIRQAGSGVVKRNTITEYPTALAIKGESIYMVGVFAGIATFGNEKITSKGKEDIFLSKYNLNGELIWVKRAGGNSQDVPNDLVLDHEGNVYMTGFFQKEADFGSKRVFATDGKEFFITKFSTNGKLIWAKQSNSKSLSQGKAIEVTKSGILVAGEFQTELGLGESFFKSFGSSDGFMAMYSPSGELLWAQKIGSPGIDVINDIQVLRRHIYVTGSFLDNSQKSVEWNSKGARDSFISKLNLDGQPIWNKAYGGTLHDEGISLTSIDDRLFMSGKYTSNFEFNDEIYLSNGYTDIFTLEIDENGEMLNVKVMGGTGQDYPSQIVSQGEDILMTGLFRNNLSTNTSSTGASDMFLSRFNTSFEGLDELRTTYFVYPNPAEEGFWIEANEEIETLEVISKDGRIIDQLKELNSKKYRFEIGELTKGLYYIRINGNTVKKVIIL